MHASALADRGVFVSIKALDCAYFRLEMVLSGINHLMRNHSRADQQRYENKFPQ
jgi:hypothetical protein